jgi:hypothetical protein
MIAHDTYTGDQWDTAFARDYESRAEEREGGAPDRRLKRWGQVALTRAMAENNISVAVKLLEGRLDEGPDLVLIDQVLRVTAAVKEKVTPVGVKVMRFLSETYGVAGLPVPPSLLWTGRYDDLMAYAFCAFGGSNVADRTLHPHLDDGIALLWNTYEGAVWELPEARRPLELTETQKPLLPYMARNARPRTIVDALTISSDAVKARLGEIIRRANEHAAHANGDDDGAAPRFTADDLDKVARYCLEHGTAWVELEYLE